MELLESSVARVTAQAEFTRPDLEIVVPFTTPQLTRAALREAERLSAGLRAHVHLIKVQVVPYPLDLRHSPVSLDFLRDQLMAMPCDLPAIVDIHFARDTHPALTAAMKPGAVIVLTSKRRPWRTREERLAAQLRRAGHEVLMRYPEKKNA